MSYWKGWVGVVGLMVAGFSSLEAAPEEADVAGVMQGLQCQDPARTRAAMLDLHAIASGSDTILNALIECHNLYSNASMESGDMGPVNPEAQVLILCSLSSNDSPMVTKTLLSLVESPRANPVLKTCAAYFLRTRPTDEVWAAMSRELKNLAPTYSEAHVPAMVLTLAHARSPASHNLLMQMARGEETSQTCLAAVALAVGLYGHPEAAALLDPLLKKASTPATRKAGLLAASMLDHPALNATLEAMDPGTMDLPTQALYALTLGHLPPESPVLLRMRSSKDPGVEAAALYALSKASSDPSSALRDLRSLCKNRQIVAEVRAQALRCLAVRPGADAFIRDTGLSSPDVPVRLAAVDALANLGGEVNLAALEERMGAETDPSVLSALLDAASPREASLVSQWLKRSSEPALLSRSLRAVRDNPSLGDRQSLVIRGLLKHASADVQEQALEALALMKPGMALVPDELLAANQITHLSLSALRIHEAKGEEALLSESLRSAEMTSGVHKGMKGLLHSAHLESVVGEVLGFEKLGRLMDIVKMDMAMAWMKTQSPKDGDTVKDEAPKPEVKKPEEPKKKEEGSGGKGLSVNLQPKSVKAKDFYPNSFWMGIFGALGGGNQAQLPQWIQEGKSLGEHVLDSPEYQMETLEYRLKMGLKSTEAVPFPRMSPEVEKEFMKKHPNAPKEMFGSFVIVRDDENVDSRGVTVTTEGTTRGGEKKKGAEAEKTARKEAVKKVKPQKELVEWQKYRVTALDVFKGLVKSDADLNLLSTEGRPARVKMGARAGS